MKKSLRMAISTVLASTMIFGSAVTAQEPFISGYGSITASTGWENLKDAAPADRMALPEVYDLRNHGLVTSVKNQNPFGTCWSFGSLSAVESAAIKAGYGSADTIDLSEHYQAWFAFQLDNGEGIEAVTDSNGILNYGSNRNVSATILTNGDGPATEAAVPYPESEAEQSIDDAMHRNASVMADFKVTGAEFLPNPAVFDEAGQYTYNAAATNVIKEKLMTNGVVEVSYCAAVALPGEPLNNKYTNLLSEQKAHYTYEHEGANHCVSIVGWDDNYAASNFKEGHQPPEAGAWIVKNSWGDYTTVPDDMWENGNESTGGVPAKYLVPTDREGYFYLSYYDMSITEPTSYTVSAANADENTYQYDYLGLKSPDSRGPSEDGVSGISANIFTAASDESLEAVSVMTAEPGSTADIAVYVLDETDQMPTDGQLVTEMKGITLDYAGYHTVALENPFDLKAGTRFAVVETIKNAEGEGYNPVERGSGKEVATEDDAMIGARDNTVRYIANVNEGESFVMENGSWVDLAKDDTDGTDMEGNPLNTGNVMIKAFTQDTDMPVTPDPTPETPDQPEPTPTPVPSTEITADGSVTTSNANTGVTQNRDMAMAAAGCIALASLGGIALYRRKQDH